jgi:hypothetical protein
MHSHPVPGDASRRRAEGQFKSSKKADLKTPLPNHRLREAEAEKTARLRALRLAKEAADKDAAERQAAEAIARKAEGRRPIRKSQASDPSEAK